MEGSVVVPPAPSAPAPATSTTTTPRPAGVWGGGPAPGTGPWGALAASTPAPCSLEDVMNEELARELQLKEDTSAGEDRVTAATAAAGAGAEIDLGCFLDPEAETEANDLLLAQMLQHQFDCEHDTYLQAEERKFNGDSKVKLTFKNYRTVHPAQRAEDSDSSEDEYLWEEKPEKDSTPTFKKNSGISGKGKNIVTKHDPEICGRKNTSRVMDRFPPEFETGDAVDMDIQLSNTVYNKLKLHSQSVDKRSQRLHEKKEHSTTEMAVDERTRLIMYKMVNNGLLDEVTGAISGGKESVVFHASGGSLPDGLVPSECAIKVFKTTLNEFKNRVEYVRGDLRFIKDEFKKQNPRRIIKMWAQKEEQNLRRLERARIRCPRVVQLRKHVLVMSFIGENREPAPKLKDARLSTVDLQIAYEQTIQMMKDMYRARLVHADLSEYNLLWFRDDVYVIDVSQAVDINHPHFGDFLLRDCFNVVSFFTKAGVPNVPNKYELFNDVTGLQLTGEGELFLKQLLDYEKKEENLRLDKGKDYPFNYFFDKSSKEHQGAQELVERGSSGTSSDSEEEMESETVKPKSSKRGKHGKKPKDKQVKSGSKGHPSQGQSGPDTETERERTES